MKFNNNYKMLAEIVGILLGDGCMYKDKYRKYQTVISFNKNEMEYMVYVKKLIEEYFQYKFCITELKNEFLLRNTSKYVGNKLLNAGLMYGNKVKNKVTIPNWIYKKKTYLIYLLRGIFDTDGSVYRKYNNYSQIQFKFASKKTISSVRDALVKLDFTPTQIMIEKFNGRLAWKIYLCKQNEIEKFFNKIKPMNCKHKIRYFQIKKWGHGDLNPNFSP